MKNQKVRQIAYLALYVALYVILKWVGNLIPFLQMPNGGSIELELIAVFIASYHLGWKSGVIVAILSWLITMLLGFPMWFVSPMQTVLDYVLPLVVVGLASFLWPFNDLKKPGAVCWAAVLALAAFFGIVFSFNKTIPAYVLGIAVAAGTAAFTYWYLRTKKYFGIVIAMLLKYVFQMLSGVYYWFPEGSAAGSKEAWTFSAGYNLWYNLVTLIVCIFVVPMLIERLKKANIRFAA